MTSSTRFASSDRAKAYASAAGAFLIASAVGLGFGSLTSGSALANEGSVPGESSKQSDSPTPSSLRALSGAQDSARYRAYEKAYDGVVFSCDASAGASSLTSAFVDERDALINPMAEGTYRISSPFGWRIDPFLGMRRMHNGVDFSAPLETPIYAVADGTVVFAGPAPFGGSDNIFVVEHEVNGEVFTTWHNHSYLDQIYVTVGDDVKAGDLLAGVGNAGRSTGPHLHFEIHPGPYAGEWVDDAVDPLEFLDERDAGDVSELCG